MASKRGLMAEASTNVRRGAALHTADWEQALSALPATLKVQALGGNAWRIVNPPDLRAALTGLPAAIDVLEKAGALR